MAGIGVGVLRRRGLAVLVGWGVADSWEAAVTRVEVAIAGEAVADGTSSTADGRPHATKVSTKSMSERMRLGGVDMALSPGADSGKMLTHCSTTL